jgi:hypothetical protein
MKHRRRGLVLHRRHAAGEHRLAVAGDGADGAMVSGAIVRGEPLGLLQRAAMLCCVASLSLVLVKKPAR